jgi:20S proteasome subunit alpha 3
LGDSPSLTQAEDMAIKVLSKTLDLTKLSSEKIEMSTLSRSENGETIIKILSNPEVDKLIAKYEKIQAEEEATKKEKLAQQQAQQQKKP